MDPATLCNEGRLIAFKCNVAILFRLIFNTDLSVCLLELFIFIFFIDLSLLMETPFIKSYFNSRLIDTIYLFQANAGLGSEVDAELDFFGSALTAVDSSTGIGAGLMKVRFAGSGLGIQSGMILS